MEIICWMATVVAMIGVFLNSRGNVVCFYLWIVSNSVFIVANVLSGSYAQAALFTFNLAMSLYGIKYWKKKEV